MTCNKPTLCPGSLSRADVTTLAFACGIPGGPDYNSPYRTIVWICNELENTVSTAELNLSLPSHKEEENEQIQIPQKSQDDKERVSETIKRIRKLLIEEQGDDSPDNWVAGDDLVASRLTTDDIGKSEYVLRKSYEKLEGPIKITNGDYIDSRKGLPWLVYSSQLVNRLNNVEERIMARMSLAKQRGPNNMLDFLERPQVDRTSFVGSRLNSYAGLLYFLQKYPSTCLFGSELVWHEKSSKVTIHVNNFQNCLKDDKVRFILGLSSLIGCNYSHSNAFLYDKRDNSVEIFEPQNKLEVGYIRDMFRYFYNLNIKKIYFSDDFCPGFSFQSLQKEEREKVVGDPYGFCTAWSLWWIEYRLANWHSQKSRERLSQQALNDLRPKGLTQFIRNYAEFVVEKRNELLKTLDPSIIDKLTEYDRILADLGNTCELNYSKLRKSKPGLSDTLDRLQLQEKNLYKTISSAMDKVFLDAMGIKGRQNI